MKPTAELKKLRKQIDRADRRLLDALALRSKVVQKIARAKHKLGLPVVHPARQAEIQKQRPKQGAKLGLNPKFIAHVFKVVQAESVQCQNKTIRQLKAKKLASKKSKVKGQS